MGFYFIDNTGKRKASLRRDRSVTIHQFLFQF